MNVVAGRYHLRRPLSPGLHLAWDARSGREVFARQVSLPPELGPQARHELAAEVVAAARAAQRPRHPAINTVLDTADDTADDTAPAGPSARRSAGPWIITAAIVGRPLHEVVATDGPLPAHRVAALGLDLLGALGAAHALGVPHRDVRPENVWITPDGHAVLTGFGAGVPAHGQAASLVGTPGFTAPEGLDRPGPAADLFSLAATLYLAVEGVPPFGGQTPMAVLSAVLADAPRPPERAGDLGPVLLARLAKDPAERPVLPGEELERLARPPAPAPRRVTVRPLPLALWTAGMTVAAASVGVIAAYTLVPASAAAQTPEPSPGRTAAGTSPSASDPGRFAAVPRACDLLSYEQADRLVTRSTKRSSTGTEGRAAAPNALATTQCDISSADLASRAPSVKIVAARFTPVLFGGGPAGARKFVRGTAEDVRETAARAGAGSAPAVRDLPGVGDEAIAYDEVMFGEQSTVVLRVSNVVATVTCRKDASDKGGGTTSVATCAEQAGRWIGETLERQR